MINPANPENGLGLTASVVFLSSAAKLAREMPVPKIGGFGVSIPDCLGVPNRVDGKTDPVGVAAVGVVLGVPKAEEKNEPDKALVVAVEVVVEGASEKVNGLGTELVAAVMTGAELDGVAAAVYVNEEANEEKLKVAGEAAVDVGANPNRGLLEDVAIPKPKRIPLPKSGAVPVGVDPACVETAGTPNFIPVDEPLADGAFPEVNPDGDGVAADDAAAETVDMRNLLGTKVGEAGRVHATVPGLKASQKTHLVASSALVM